LREFAAFAVIAAKPGFWASDDRVDRIFLAPLRLWAFAFIRGGARF